ncbi:MAG: hypothetical protein Q8L14_23290 [Myxococcales bacterium]|nr:hypothetical protein [Myxococcales bacterium]
MRHWMFAMLTSLAAACASPRADAEHARVQAHLEGALVMVEAATPKGLTPAQLEARHRLIHLLREYIDAGRYPVNDVSPERTPIFIDRAATRCAMAYLIEQTGHGALVDRVARTNNLARVHQLAADEELGQWLTSHGMTLAEAARVQPSYDNLVTTRWAPTFAVLATGSVGGALATGLELGGGPALRGGARHISETTGACDDCVYRTVAVMLEYARLFQLGRPSTNQLALLTSWDLLQQSRDHSVYVLAGATAHVDESAPVQLGLGALGGMGFGWREGVPWFVEGVLSAMWQTRGLALRVAASFGFSW